MGKESIIVGAIRECRTEEELDYVFDLFLSEEPDATKPRQKCCLLMLAMGDCKYFDLPQDDEKRAGVLKALFLQGAWRAPYEMDLAKKLVGKYL